MLEYVRSSPTARKDPTGQQPITTPTGPPPLRDRVIPCPCTVHELHGIVALRTEDPSWSVSRYHPGATSCSRICRPSKDCYAGNQCCYDANGNLITHGAGAGTPDLFSVACDVRLWSEHVLHDVAPYEGCMSIPKWREYHRKGWAPVSDPSCPRNQGGDTNPPPTPGEIQDAIRRYCETWCRDRHPDATEEEIRDCVEACMDAA